MTKTLILCVDRDDDLGRKAGVVCPIIGRKGIQSAALRLGVADPGDSDTNALLLAMKLYDEESAERHDQVEVACISGHTNVGLRSDRILAQQLDEVLMVTKADELILVTDGAEDEQIVPIIQTRIRVIHKARSIVKQAPRIEGFLYILTQMMDDEKLAKKYLLPLATITLVWAIAFFVDRSRFAWAITLGIVGIWLMIHALGWQEKVGRALRDFKEGIRTGRLSLVATFVGIAIVAVGCVQSWQMVPIGASNWIQVLTFADNVLPYVVSGFLVRIAGQLMEELIADGRAAFTHWTLAFALISLGIIGGVLLDLSLAALKGQDVTRILSFDMAVRLLVGLAILLGGIVLGRYMRGVFAMEPEQKDAS